MVLMVVKGHFRCLWNFVHLLVRRHFLMDARYKAHTEHNRNLEHISDHILSSGTTVVTWYTLAKIFQNGFIELGFRRKIL